MKIPRRLLAVALLLSAASMLAAQVSDSFVREGRRNRPLREGLPERMASFTFCRLQYESVRYEARGLGWSTDYPGADANFVLRLSQLTKTGVSHWADAEPGYAVVRATDPNLFRCPFLFASDVGTAGLGSEEVDRLREFLLKGGFLWVDDFWGTPAWNHWVAIMQRIVPEYEIVDLEPGHGIYSVFTELQAVPQIPSIQFWYQTGGRTSERGADSPRANLRGIFDERGRLLVLMTHNTDIADGWEREGDNEEFFRRFSPDAYALGVNVAIWTMTR